MRNWACIAVSSAFLIGCATAAEVWLKDDKLVKSVEEQVHKLQPTRQEKRFDEIGWAPSILAAEALAKQHNRAVFLFTYDGKIDTGRC
jgi:hypothetical protein